MTKNLSSLQPLLLQMPDLLVSFGTPYFVSYRRAVRLRFLLCISSTTEIEDFPLCVNSTTEIKDFLSHLCLTYRYAQLFHNVLELIVGEAFVTIA